MVTRNILQRTFKIKFGESIATCFTLDIENRQYIITARHVVQKIAEDDEIEIYQNGQWNKLPVRLVGLGENDIDVAVMALPQQLPLSPPPPLIHVADEDLFLSQDVYFLGFPYGLQTDVSPEINLSFPIPLVKKGIISSLEWDNGKISYMLLDGHNNRGFSGGPVFSPLGNGTQESKQVGVIGVISGYRLEWEETFRGQTTESELIGYYRSNTGIILAYSINHAINIIHRNPIGFNLG